MVFTNKVRSNWYILWNRNFSFHLPTKENKENEILCIYEETPFFISYKFAKNNVDSILEKIKKHYQDSGKTIKDSDLNEVEQYIEEFVDEVDKYYKPFNWFNECLIPKIFFNYFSLLFV